MFVPIGLLVQSATVVRDMEGIVKVLDQWVLPHYPEFTTKNPHMTKTQCMGVLHSYYAAGKIHYSITPQEVEMAVDAFLTDRLWLDTRLLETINLFESQKPSNWLRQPNPVSCVLATARLWLEAFRTTVALFCMAVGSIAYKFIPKKKFSIPENPSLKVAKS